MRGRWAGEPWRLQAVAAVLVAVLLWGCGQHVADLMTGGVDVYRGFPGWMAAYWTALTVADPLAAFFVALRHRFAWLAAAILVSDGLVTLHAHRLLAATTTVTSLSLVGPLLILLLGLATTLLIPHLRRDQGTSPP